MDRDGWRPSMAGRRAYMAARPARAGDGIGESTPRRFVPRGGEKLDLGHIRGPWRPSATVEACGVFAVLWFTPSGAWWAPLHDFEPPAQLKLIEMCRWLDRGTGWRGSRADMGSGE